MAKIAKYEILVDGQRIELPINCSSMGAFSTKFPAFIVTTVKGAIAEFGSKAELEKHIDKVVSEYHQLTEQVTLCIRFESERRTFRTMGDFDSDKERSAFISLRWLPLMRVQRGASVRWFVLQDRSGMRPFSDHRIPENLMLYASGSEYTGQLVRYDKGEVPLTVETLQFFKSFEQSIKDMQDKITQAMTPANVELVAMTGGSLLPELVKTNS